MSDICAARNGRSNEPHGKWGEGVRKPLRKGGLALGHNCFAQIQKRNASLAQPGEMRLSALSGSRLEPGVGGGGRREGRRETTAGVELEHPDPARPWKTSRETSSL